MAAQAGLVASQEVLALLQVPMAKAAMAVLVAVVAMVTVPPPEPERMEARAATVALAAVPVLVLVSRLMAFPGTVAPVVEAVTVALA